MTKLKKTRIGLYSAIGVICLVLVIGVGAYVSGYSSQEPPQTVMENVNIEAYNTNEFPQEDRLGAVSGPDFYGPYFTVHAPLVDGGDYLDATTTMQIAFSLTAAQICESNVITVNSACAATTVACSIAASTDITLAATSTLFTTCLKEPGAHTSFILANLSPTAASTTQIVAGAGGDLYEPDDSSDHDVEIAGGAMARINIWRLPLGFESNLDMIVTVEDFSAAD